jgi:hypothetical protein
MRIVRSRKVYAPSFALLWLTGRKQTGKICRGAAVLVVREPGTATGIHQIYKMISTA